MHLWLHHWRAKMGFPAPLVLTGQQAIQINQLQCQWDTLFQKLKWSPLASTIHICIHVLLNMHHAYFQRHTLTWICTCPIPHMHGNTYSKFGSMFRQPGSFGDEFCPDGISHIKGRTSDLPGMHEMYGELVQSRGWGNKWMMWLEDSWLNALFARKMGCRGWLRKEFIVSALGRCADDVWKKALGTCCVRPCVSPLESML